MNRERHRRPLPLAKMGDGGAFAAFICARRSRSFHDRVGAKLIAHDLAEGTCTFTVDDPDPRHSGEIRVVDVGFEDGGYLFGAVAAKIYFEIDVRSGRSNEPL